LFCSLFDLAMNSLVKVVVLSVFLLACVSWAEEEKKPKEPVYSSFECEGYDKDHPDDLSMRNCILRNVVVASEKGQPVMLFYAREGQDTPLLAADKEAGKGHIVEIAPKIFASVKVVREALPDDFEPADDTAVLTSAQGNNLQQFLFDTMFSVYWMLTKTGDIPEDSVLVKNPKAVTIVEVGRHNDYAEIMQGSLTMKTLMPLRSVKGVVFARVIAGHAGHQMMAHVKSEHSGDLIDRKLVERYREFFLKAAKVSDDEYLDSRVILSQRFTSKKITNTDDVFSAANEVGNAQVAFLSHLPIRSQIDIVSSSAVFISTHSEDMAYMLFLRPGSSIIEVMPYGVECDVNKKLAELCGLKYFAWHNKDRSRARFDPKILDTFPLTPEQKKAITEADKYDPSLPNGALAYWTAQDTKVNPDDIKEILRQILPAKEATPKQETDKSEL